MITLQLKTERTLKNVRLLRTDKKLDFSVRDGWIKCIVSELQRFEIVLYEYE
jgi:hypothetical protein